MTTLAAIRTAIAGKLAALYSVKVDPVAEITVTSGATEAIFDAIQAVVRRDGHCRVCERWRLRGIPRVHEREPP